MESAIAWVMPRGGTGPEFLRQRRRRLLVLDDGELRVTRRPTLRRRTRSTDEASDVLARIPVPAGSLRADRNLITLRRLVIEDVGGPITLEFGMRARDFARTLAAAAA